LARLGATFTSTFATPDVGWTWPVAPDDADAPMPLDAFAPDGAALDASLGAGAVTDAPLGAGAVTDAPLGAGAVTDAPAFGVAGDGVIVAGVVGAGAVTEAPVPSLGFAGSAMSPGDVVTVVPAFRPVSAGVAFFVVSGCVVCCAAAGIDSAASSTAANAYRCVMVQLSCIMMLWVRRLHSTDSTQSTAHTMRRCRKIVIFP
jgi:hypothetical protein